MAEKQKIVWLAVLQGFSMLLVVIGHVSLTNLPGDPNTPIATGIERIIYSFHMPLFVFISGWLFYYTCISRGKTYCEMFISKAKRLAIPFMFFTIVTMALKLLFPQLMHRIVDWKEIVDTFIFFRSNPLGEMWFVIVLFELMLLYPLYRIMIEKKFMAIILLIATIVLSRFAPAVSYYFIDKVLYMFPFFFAGIVSCKYNWHILIGKMWFLILALFCFIFSNIIGILPLYMKTEAALVGILFSMSFCLVTANYLPRLFHSFRDYTFQIFLMGIFFQMVIRWIYVRLGNDQLFVPMWIFSVIIGVYMPTLIALCIKRFAPLNIRLCFGL